MTQTPEHDCETPDDEYADGPWSWTCPVCGTKWEAHMRKWWERAEEAFL